MLVLDGSSHLCDTERMEKSAVSGVYRDICRKYAHELSQATWNFWANLVEDFDAGHLDVEDVRSLIFLSDSRQKSRPDRATAYRHLAKWRALLVEVRNAGRGA